MTSGSSVDPAATLGSVAFGTCSGWLGATTLTQVGTWKFEAESGATTGSDVITGHVNDLSMKLTGSLCSMSIIGAAAATYNEATGVLAINHVGFDGDGYITASTGCGSHAVAGAPLDFTATFQVATVGGFPFAANAINIG
ncbi:hypothetical protein [Nocardioides sp.]|uniref:hypothetical protein n=1 Tax=Nocardioides sp. TaxID=35761 RepID=UPI002603A3C9|nr:hypothetical protein [Nocardioides sp.]